MNKKRQTAIYVVLDIIAAMITWFCFFSYRKFHEPFYDSAQQVYAAMFSDYKFYLGITLIPLSWIILYMITGTYRSVYRKSRIKELESIFRNTLFGSLLLFFVIILDDHIVDYTDYIKLFIILFGLQCIITGVFRFVVITITNNAIHSGKLQFNTILVGGGKLAFDLFKNMEKQKQHSGTRFVGFVAANGVDTSEMEAYLPKLGTYVDLPQLIKRERAEELIIAIGNGQRAILEKIFSVIDEQSILIKILPKTEDYILGTVKNTAIFNEPLIQIHLDFMPPLWQKIVKRGMDIVLSMVFIILCSPLYLILAIGVKRSSPGPILFRQERVGYKGKPFHIIKFRSMYVDSEQNGPQLSSKNDERITKFGRFMRRTHFDELPQFFNVISGEMSLVGPRPERKYYINQIVQVAPHYRLLLLTKPGLTSWGQVTYGYAENVDQMVERLRYDMMYIENMSLLVDIKILFYTLVAVLKFKGK